MNPWPNSSHDSEETGNSFWTEEGYVERNMKENTSIVDALAQHFSDTTISYRNPAAAAAATEEYYRERYREMFPSSSGTTEETYKGLKKIKSKWGAQIRHCNKYIWLGSFKTKAEAALAYDKTAFRLWGMDAKLNFRENVQCVDSPNPYYEAPSGPIYGPLASSTDAAHVAIEGGQSYGVSEVYADSQEEDEPTGEQAIYDEQLHQWCSSSAYDISSQYTKHQFSQQVKHDFEGSSDNYYGNN